MRQLKNNYFSFLSILLCFVAVKAQQCTPGPVSNITLSSANRLSWGAADASICTIKNYVINVFDLEDQLQLQYLTNYNVLYYQLTLDMCKLYSFEVHALSDENVFGPSVRINVTTTSTPNANFSLNITNVALNNNSQISLDWDPIVASVTRCITYYRVVYWDETNLATDVYVFTNKFTLQRTPIPCDVYKFQVSAIIQNPDTEGPLAETSFSGYDAVPDPPQLVTILTGPTTVNMTWKLPTIAETRCELKALVLDIVGQSSVNRYTIQDSALRPNIVVFLDGLTPNRVYISYVSLINSVGTSKNVSITFQTSSSYVFNPQTDLFYDF